MQLAVDHPDELAYDFMSMGVNPARIGLEVSWNLAARLAGQFAMSPTHHTGAAVMRLAHPVTREDMVLRDLYDLIGSALSRRHRPYPRPFDNSTRLGGTNRSRTQVERILRERAPHRGTPPRA